MRNFLRHSKIYWNAFRVEEIRSRFVGNKLIGYDVKNDEVILDTSPYRNFRETLHTIFLFYITSTMIPTSFTTELIDIYKLPFVLFAIFCYIFAIIFRLNHIKYRQTFMDLILTLETIDYWLNKYDGASKRGQINYHPLMATLTLASFVYFIIVPFSVSIWYYGKLTNVLSMLIVSHSFAAYIHYILISRILIIDRLNRFNALISVLYRDANVIDCRLCKRQPKSKRLCCYHTIQYIDRIYKLFTLAFDLWATLNQMIMDTVIMYTMTVVMGNISIVLSRLMVNSAPFDTVDCYLLHGFGVYFTMTAALYQILVDIAQCKLQEVARKAHKFYFKSILDKDRATNPTFVPFAIETCFPKHYKTTCRDFFVLGSSSILLMHHNLVKIAFAISHFFQKIAG